MIRVSEIIAMVLIGTWAGILAPQRKGDGYRQIVRMITGFSLILVIAETAFTVSENVRKFLPELGRTISSEWEKGEEIHREAQDWVTGRGIRNVEQGAAALVRSRFKTEVEVIAESSADANGTVSIDSLRILVEKSSAADLFEIENYLENLLSCRCQAEYAENFADEGDRRM